MSSASPRKEIRIALVAPSGPVDPEALEIGKQRLLARQPHVRFLDAPNITARTGYLAGDDDARIEGFLWAFREADADWVWFARGGFGTTRIIDALPWSELAATGRRLIGYSDATAFLAAYQVAGGPAFHAPMIAADYARNASARSVESVDRILFGDGVDEYSFDGTMIGADRIEGPIVVGNIAVLAAMAGTRHLPNARGRVVCLEEVHEEPYRVDRCLTQLARVGFFDGARAIVFGAMTDCVPEDPAKSWTMDEVLMRWEAELGLPAVLGFPFGHGGTNSVLPVGGTLRIEWEGAGLTAAVSITA